MTSGAPERAPSQASRRSRLDAGLPLFAATLRPDRIAQFLAEALQDLASAAMQSGVSAIARRYA